MNIDNQLRATSCQEVKTVWHQHHNNGPVQLYRTVQSSVSSQMTTYMSVDCAYTTCHSTASRIGDSTGNNWTSYIILHALRALSVPASNSPIELVFSKGTLIMMPLRSKLSDTRVSALIFLKCNGVCRMWQWQWSWLHDTVRSNDTQGLNAFSNDCMLTVWSDQCDVFMSLSLS